MNISSVSSLMCMLDDSKTELKIFALRELLKVVDEFWYEISEVIEKLKILHEDETFEQKKMAALLVSKVYFHLGSLEDSLTYALHAEELFDIDSGTEYVKTLIGKCIDSYTKEEHVTFYDEYSIGFKYVDEDLEDLFNRLFQRCLDCGEFKIALGLAVDSTRVDLFQTAVTESNNVHDMLSYAYTVSTTLIPMGEFKTLVLNFLPGMFENLERPDYVRMCQCFIFCDRAERVVRVLLLLIHGNEEDELMLYQLAFDLCESATQEFLGRVTEMLTLQGNEEQHLRIQDKNTFVKKTRKVLYILSGIRTVRLYSIFLKMSHKTDTLFLYKTMQRLGNSVSQTGAVIANGFICNGTNDNRFLIYNLQRLGQPTNCEMTSAVASMGVIHRGQIEGSLKIIQNYKDIIVRESGYVKSGFLYALGLIHANLGGDVIDYLVKQLKNAESEEVRHGGCLGLGLAAMGTNREDLYQLLKSHLHLDEACTGEAAGIAMGMVMLGSNNKLVIEDMVSYAQETQHEKILRGLSVGIALVMYGRFDEANALIEQLEVSSDAILRRSAMYTMAMAYCGTGNTKAVKKFLHVAISDPDDDVRRAAVTGLGFLLFKTPELCQNLVSLLTDSYNPHVRYGATMALGIACAGTGMREALDLLKPIIESDQEDFVRQGAFIASAMILMQHNEETCPQVNFFRKSYADTVENKHENEISKFGAILAQGIIDAGGRNVTLSLQSRTGHTHMLSVVGTLMFTQFWYWFPMAHCLSLAFTPTYLIALNSDLLMPKLDFKSNAKPGMFAYPPPLESKKEERKIQVKVDDSSQKITVDEEPEDKNKIEIETKEGQLSSTFELLSNPARVLKNQLEFISINDTTRYVPMRDLSFGGIVMVQNLKPLDEEELVVLVPNYIKSSDDHQVPQL